MERIVHGGDVYGGNAGLLDFSVCLNPAGAPKGVLRAAQEGVLRARAIPTPSAGDWSVPPPSGTGWRKIWCFGATDAPTSLTALP